MVLLIVLVAGVYKFTFTNDDVHVENEDGEMVKYEEFEKNKKDVKTGDVSSGSVGGLGKVKIPDTGVSKFYNDTTTITKPFLGTEFYGQDAGYQIDPPSYTDNKDGTVTDNVTGLTWSKAVNTKKVSLEEAEKIASGMKLGGHADWRVPPSKSCTP